MNNTARELLQQFPSSDFLIIGGEVLERYSIRRAHGVDIIVKEALWEQLLSWKPVDESRQMGSVTAMHSWKLGNFQASFEELQSKSATHQGLPYISLEDLFRWKQIVASPRDYIDCHLIQQYLQQRQLHMITVIR